MLSVNPEYAERDREIARREFIRGVTIVFVTSFQLSKALNWPRVETIYIYTICRGNSMTMLRVLVV